MLSVSDSTLEFELRKEPGLHLEPISREIFLTNVSNLVLTANLTCPLPFHMTQDTRLVLKPNETHSITVHVSPSELRTKNSFSVNRDLVIAYAEHAQTDLVVLKLNVAFPNIAFSESGVHFGCIPNYTKSFHSIKMVNDGPLSVAYSWAFADPAPTNVAEVWLL